MTAVLTGVVGRAAPARLPAVAARDEPGGAVLGGELV